MEQIGYYSASAREEMKALRPLLLRVSVRQLLLGPRYLRALEGVLFTLFMNYANITTGWNSDVGRVGSGC